MSKTTVFISGPVSGLPYNEVVKAFNGAEQRLRRQGYNVVKNPVRMCMPCWSWLRCMVVCLWNLLPVGTIYMLPGWEDSKGACIERLVAKMLLKRVIYGVAVGNTANYSAQDS